MPPTDPSLTTLIDDDADPGETIRFDDDGPQGPTAIQAARLESALALGGVLGTGGMAVVREAHQRVLGRTVAVKSSKASDGSGSAGRLVTEARITGALEHPGILPVHDILQDADGLPHIVLKRVEGRAWSDVMDDPALLEQFGATDALGFHLEVLDAVCNAVHFAHTHGVVHRDLKPENVMVGSFGQVYVLDWGIAVSLADDPRFPSAAEQRRVVGTPRYMAPEMVGGDGRKVSVQTDVYLLGAILYRILVGRPPHGGLGIRAILDGIHRFRPSLPDAPAELAELVVDAMEAEPTRRPASAEVFRRRLRAFVEHRGAATLAESAERRLAELGPLLDGADADRVRAYDLFGAIRFGFQEVLAIWPEHPTARERLAQVCTRMAAWELDQGDDRAAEVLLAGIDVDPALAERLRIVRDARLAAVEQAEELARERNQRIGQRVRAGLALLFTILWGAIPQIGLGEGGPGALMVGLAWCAIVGVALYLYREKWLATQTNRTVLVLLGSALVAQVLLAVAQNLGGVDQRAASSVIWLVNGSFCLAGAFQIHRGFAVPAVVYAVAFLVYPWLGEWRPHVSSVANGLVGAVGVVMWWPRRSDDHSAGI